MTTATLSTAPCRPRSLVVEEHLPELLAAFSEREDLRRARRPLVDLLQAADRLDRARDAIRGC